eukprot:SAG22_NODE_4430_length_1272_cov_0.953112_3_plen_48_part_01
MTKLHDKTGAPAKAVPAGRLEPVEAAAQPPPLAPQPPAEPKPPAATPA